MITTVADHAQIMRDRLARQFQTSAFFKGVISAIGPRLNELETAFQALLTIDSIEESSGAQLDLIGKILGLQRQGLSDVPYQAVLRAQIVANRSSGTIEDLLAIVRLSLAPYSVTSIVLREVYPAAIEIHVAGTLATAPMAVIGILLGEARAAGVGLDLIYNPAPLALITCDLAVPAGPPLDDLSAPNPGAGTLSSAIGV